MYIINCQKNKMQDKSVLLAIFIILILIMLVQFYAPANTQKWFTVLACLAIGTMVLSMPQSRDVPLIGRLSMAQSLPALGEITRPRPNFTY